MVAHGCMDSVGVEWIDDGHCEDRGEEGDEEILLNFLKLYYANLIPMAIILIIQARVS